MFCRGVCMFSSFPIYDYNLQADPYLKGEVMPMQDRNLYSSSDMNSEVLAVKEAVYSLNNLEMKLKVCTSIPLSLDICICDLKFFTLLD